MNNFYTSFYPLNTGTPFIPTLSIPSHPPPPPFIPSGCGLHAHFINYQPTWDLKGREKKLSSYNLTERKVAQWTDCASVLSGMTRTLLSCEYSHGSHCFSTTRKWLNSWTCAQPFCIVNLLAEQLSCFHFLAFSNILFSFYPIFA